MITLLAAFLQTRPALWLSKTNLSTLAVSDAVERPFVVVPSNLVDDPKVAELRKAGAKLVLSFNVYSPPVDEKDVPPAWYVQAVYAAVSQTASKTGALTLENDDALAFQTERAATLGTREAEFVGVTLSVDMASNATFRYAAADRSRAIAATGLDPVDFDAPNEFMYEGVKRTPQPKALVDFLRKTGHDRALQVALALAKPFAAKGKMVALRIDPALLDPAPARHVVAYGDWTTMLDLPGLTTVWAPAGAKTDAIKLREILGRVGLGFYGTSKDLPAEGPRIETL